MTRNELNLSYIRTLSRGQHLQHLLSSVNHANTPKVSRRGFLQIASAAGLHAQLTGLAKFSGLSREIRLSNRITLVQAPGKVTLRLDDEDKFIIDCTSFCDGPKLSVTDTGRSYVVSLLSARFPGLRIRGDLELELWPSGFGWAYRILFKELGLLFRGPLEEWLSSSTAPKSNFKGAVGVAADRNWILDLNGTANVTFEPDWKLHFEGQQIATTSIDNASLISDSFAVRPAVPDEKSLLRWAPKKRSTVILKRGDKSWNLFPRFASTDTLRLESDDSPFDELIIDAGETRVGNHTAAFLAQSVDNTVRITAHPLPYFEAPTDESFALPLSRLQYAGALHTSSRYLSANLPNEGTKWHVGSLTYSLQNNPKEPTFEAQSSGEKPAVSIRPRTELNTNLPGAIVLTSKVPSSAAVPLTFGRFLCKAGYFLHLDCETQKAFSSAHGLRLQVLRPKDLLHLEFEFQGLKFEHCFGKSYLVPLERPEDARLIVHFPPQALAEEATWSKDPSCELPSGGSPIPNPPVRTRLSNRSRLVFKPFPKPDSPNKLLFELQDLMNWNQWQLIVGKFARPLLDCEGKVDLAKAQAILNEPEEPSALESSIELPYRVIISPDDRAQFETAYRHSDNDRPRSSHLVLWHASLTTPREIRVVWTREESGEFCPKQILEENGKVKEACKASIDPIDRKDLRRAFTTYSGNTYQETPYYPPVMPLRVLALSSLGGWFDGSVKWDPVRCENLESWRQVIASGRDQIVRFGRAGFLIPTGHPATLITVTQREWTNKDGEQFAYLIKRCYIQVKQRAKEYPAPGQLNDARDLPFKKIVITLDRTPYLDPASCVGPLKDAFWARVCDKPFQFPLELTDHDGNITTSSLPMQFVPINIALGIPGTCPDKDKAVTGSKDIGTILSEYSDETKTNTADRTSFLNSQKIAFAKSSSPRDTAFATDGIVWKTSTPSSDSQSLRHRSLQPPFYPALDHGFIALDAAQHFSQKSNASEKLLYLADVSYAEPYIVKGFPSDVSKENTGEVFLEVVHAPKFSFAGEKSGGIVLPSAQIGALSRRFGMVGGNSKEAVENASSGKFVPVSFFKDLFDPEKEATLFGALKLAELVAPISNIADQVNKVPRLIQEEIRDVRAQYEMLRNQIDQISQQVDRLLEVMNQYFAAATQAASAIRNAAETQIINLRKACSYQDIPPELRDAAEKLRVRADNIRKDFEKALKDLPENFNISLLREYIILKITDPIQVLDVTEQQLLALREKFRITAEEKIALVEASIRDAVSQLVERPVGKALQDVSSELKASIQAANPEQIFAVVGKVRSAVEDLGTAATIIERVNREAKSISTTIHDRINAVQTQLQNDLESIQKQIDDERWKLSETARNAIKSQLEKWKGALFAHLEQIRSAITAELYDAKGAVLGSLPQKTVEIFSHRAEQIESEITALRSFLNQVLEGFGLPTEVRMSYHFVPQLQDAPPGNPIFRASRGGRAASLVVDGTLTQKFDGTPPLSKLVTVLEDFELLLFPFAPFLELAFEQIKFSSENGNPPNVFVKIADCGFVGPLDFVKGLQEKFKLLNGDSRSGPYLTVQPTSLQAGFRFAIPSITTGAFNLSHVTFHTALRLPFLGDPMRLIFSFADRARPFHLSFLIFGGGGFLSVEATAKGIEQVEGALEFGAIAELNLGVAHGGVSLMGGFYFRKSSDSMLLSGYLRAVGELNILGLISMTVQFYLALSWEKRPDASYLVGECTVSVEISFAFFSVSVDLTLRKEFKGDVPQQGSNPGGVATVVGAIMPISLIPQLSEQFIATDWRQQYTQYLSTYAW